MRWLIGILATLLVLALPASAQSPRRVALVIGNATYANAGRLMNPPNDARLVANALAQAGFQTVDARADLGVQAFGRALRDFRARANGAQVALVYYAGHGIEGNGRNWLIPTDAALGSEFDLTYEAISLDQVMDALTGADLRVVILDACRDNPLGRSWNRGTRAVARGLAPVDADDVLVIYAAAPGQTAADGAGAVNSPFATALARRLPEAGLPIQLLGGRVRDDVLRATGSVQRPFVSASITGEPFYLVGASGAQRPPASVPVGAPSSEALELAAWQGALAANSQAAFEDYLRQYPAGRFRVLAQQNIARFAVRQPSPSAALGATTSAGGAALTIESVSASRGAWVQRPDLVQAYRSGRTMYFMFWGGREQGGTSVKQGSVVVSHRNNPQCATKDFFCYDIYYSFMSDNDSMHWSRRFSPGGDAEWFGFNEGPLLTFLGFEWSDSWIPVAEAANRDAGRPGDVLCNRRARSCAPR